MPYYLKCARPLCYHFSGLFLGNESWIHAGRTLRDYELMVITRGTLFMRGDEEAYRVERGEYLLLGPGMYQEGTRASDCDFHWLHFAERETAEEAPVVTVLPHGCLRNLERVIIFMKQIQDCARSYHHELQNDLMCSALLCELANQHCSPAGYSRRRNQQLYNDILDYIAVSVTDDLRVSKLAERFGYNEKYISHLFTSLAGVPLKQYILRQKMEYAKSMLSDTNHTVTAIAEELGFSNVHHFMRTFKRIVGMTPSTFRNAFGHRLAYRYVDPLNQRINNSVIGRKLE